MTCDVSHLSLPPLQARVISLLDARDGDPTHYNRFCALISLAHLPAGDVLLLVAGPNDDVHGSSVAGSLCTMARRTSRVRQQHATRDFLVQASFVPPSSSTRCRRGRGATRKVCSSTRARGTSFGWLISRCFRWHFTLAVLLRISPRVQPDEERGAGHVVATHNPFTAPAPQCEKHLVEVSNHCHSPSRSRNRWCREHFPLPP